MQVAEHQKLKPIGPWVKGQIVGYVHKEQERQRYLLSKRRWFIVHVEPQREFKIRNAIIDLQYGAYCPYAMRKVRQIGEKYRECKKPIFVGYLFANFDPDDEPWHSHIRDMEGVLKVFTINERPVPVGDLEMDCIREAEQRERDRAHRKTPAEVRVSVGDFVQVKAGPFTGFFGFVTEVDAKHGNLKIELNIFSRPTPVELEGDQVEVALDSPRGLSPFSRPQYQRPRSPR
jgi:transcription termination/antitermination protein NusG